VDHVHPSAARTGSAAVAAIGIDHARLTYAYLNNGDIDTYASLFDEAAVVRSPGRETIHGRAALEKAQADSGDGARTRFVVQNVFASGNRVAATGRLTRDIVSCGYGDIEFADIFTIGESGLFVAQSTYFFMSTTGRGQ
jgi:hypothetical protein